MTAAQLAASARTEVEWSPLTGRAAADYQRTYGHTVVDEAQDLLPMVWHALLRHCPPRPTTIVGNLDQHRGKNRPHTWIGTPGPARRAYSGEHVPSASYRTPATLAAITESVMTRVGEPTAHPTKTVRDVENCYRVVRVKVESEAGGPIETKGEACSGNEAHPRDETEAKAKIQQQGETSRGGEFLVGHESVIGRKSVHTHERLVSTVKQVVNLALKRLDAEPGEGSGRVAVIVDSQRVPMWGADVMGSRGLGSRVPLLSAPASKGLEFDSVILIEPAELLEGSLGNPFVIPTRAAHDVTVLRGGELPAEVEEW